MAGKQGTPDPNPFGFFFAPLRFAIWLALTCIGLALMSLLMQITVAKLVWPAGQGQERMRALVQAEALHLGMPNDALSYRMGRQLAESVYALEFRATGLHRVVVEHRRLPVISKLAANFGEEIRIAMTGTWLVGFRMASAAGVLWLVVLVWVIGFTDGLAERAARRECAGRESANLYHRAKYFHFFGLPVTLAMYCTLPFSVSPALMFYPIVFATALLSRMQWKYYKKYL